MVTVAHGEGSPPAVSLRPKAGLGVIAACILALITLVSTAYLLVRNGSTETSEIWVPRRTIPAYTRIDETDVATRSVPVVEISANSVREKDSLVGHVALRHLAQDAPVEAPSIGAVITRESLRGTFVTPLDLTFSQALSGQLRSGDLVTIDGRGRNSIPVRVDNVLVLDCRVQPDGSSFTAVLAPRSSDITGMASLNANTAIVTRTRPYRP